MINVKEEKPSNSSKLQAIKPLSFSPFSLYYPGCSDLLFPHDSKLCAICLSAINSFQARPNACDHIYCSKCLNFWSRKKKICPLCRTRFTRIIYI